MNRRILTLVILISLALLFSLNAGLNRVQAHHITDLLPMAASPVGTAFTYQGQLVYNGAPVNDACDITFSLWDELGIQPGDGNKIGSDLMLSDVVVNDGLFTVSLDFGTGIFTGDALWLQILVDCNNLSDLLWPRQPLTPAPYSIRSESAADADTVDGEHASAFADAGHIHSANSISPQGDNSGLDADFLDGQDSSDFAGASHSHNDDYWSLTGNVSTVPGTHFLGTTDDQALELHVNSSRSLRLEPHATSPNFIAGHPDNAVLDDAYGGVIGGGGNAGAFNQVYDNYGTVAGGRGNQVGSNNVVPTNAEYATVGGGENNEATANHATVGGGENNEASISHATIAGGFGNAANYSGATVAGGMNNTASGLVATIGGGQLNTADGNNAMIPGGAHNRAQGEFSLAAGHRARALYDGSFVWADSTDVAFASTTDDQFNVRANGGVRFETGGTGMQIDDNEVWHTGNGGAGSSLDADLLDGQHASTFANASHFHSELRASGSLGLEVQAASYEEGPNVIGGSHVNEVASGVQGATIGGGGDPNAPLFSDSPNTVFDDYGTIGGGKGNTAGSDDASNDDGSATVGGGAGNRATASCATVGGGASNGATDEYATVSGGESNYAGGGYAMVPGGYDNDAVGDYSFAAGQRAKANHQGTFVWADDYPWDFQSTADSQFNVRANGGVRFILGINASGNPTWECSVVNGGLWTCTSDRNLKENLIVTDNDAILNSLAQVPIYYWNGIGSDVSHIGPMSQDFYNAFGVGENDTSLSTIDLDGVALASIQGLYQLAQEQSSEIEVLQQQIADLEALVMASGQTPDGDPDSGAGQ